MSHYKINGATRAEATAPGWLKVGSQIGELVNEWAGRGDLVVYVGPGAGGPAPACYSPDLLEVEVNTDAAFGKGLDAGFIGDMTDRETQFDWPKASGAILHEALHARYTRWSLHRAAETLSDPVLKALHLLEESRIEKYGVITMPDNREFLRACALEIVLADLESAELELTSTEAAAHILGLTLARVDAGVLEKEDVQGVVDIVETFIGEELIAKLRNIWLQFQAHLDHRNAEPLYVLATEWVAVLGQAMSERGEKSQAEQQAEFSEMMEKLMDALGEAAGDVAISANEELGEQQESEAWKTIVTSRGQNSKEQNDHKRVSNTIFEKGVGPTPGSPTSSRLRETRVPTSQERAAAVKVAQLLEKAKYRERSEVETKRELPPGRLRTRALVQGSAARAQGIQTKVEPWRHTSRKHTDDPTLSVGVMVDISGSMGSAMQPMAVAAWALSEATRRVQGRAAMVYYGSDVFATLKPGQHLKDVNVYTAPDGTEKFDKAFKALDGSMNLLHGDGARLLVIVSDGYYTGPESEAARNWMLRCEAAGVAVTWITFAGNHEPAYYLKGTAGEVVYANGDTAKVIEKIGNAAATALGKIGQRNAA